MHKPGCHQVTSYFLTSLIKLRINLDNLHFIDSADRASANYTSSFAQDSQHHNRRIKLVNSNRAKLNHFLYLTICSSLAITHKTSFTKIYKKLKNSTKICFLETCISNTEYYTGIENTNTAHSWIMANCYLSSGNCFIMV